MRPGAQVLVSGFPNSGTSFLCNLIVEMGLSPGSSCNLKGPDNHNRWGYWEHLPLRKLVWSNAGGGRLDVSRIPERPIHPRAKLMIRIEQLCREDGIEVYKDSSLPWTYPLFSHLSAFVIIQRDPKILYQRYYRSLPLDRFAKNHDCYQELVGSLRLNRTCWTVNYQDFHDDLEGTIRDLCVFLGRSYRPDLCETWRPR